jgi:hypothetical protein
MKIRFQRNHNPNYIADALNACDDYIDGTEDLDNLDNGDCGKCDTLFSMRKGFHYSEDGQIFKGTEYCIKCGELKEDISF